MVVSDLPKLKYTPVEEIPARVDRLRKSFYEHKTRDVEFRLVQLRKLYWAIKDHEQEIAEALSRDLGKPLFESDISEYGWLENDIVFITRNLHRWIKDETPQDIDLAHKFLSPKIKKDPFGCVLVIGAFNFPFQLTLGPVLGAIAAGNTVVIKPSENSSYSAAMMQKIVESALDPTCYTVIQGGVAESQALLAEKWDKIFFTGSANVGRIVAKAAAPHLTPVVLELGGINPGFVTKNANLRLVARRMLWGKTLNAGQVCTSENYLLVEKEVVQQLVEEFKQAYKEFYPRGAKASSDYARIINENAFRRIKSMIDDSKGKILLGGTMDEKDRFIEPTLVQVDSPDDSLIKDESFGPIITILPVNSLDEAINIANGVMSTPLGLYPFGNKAEIDKIIGRTRSGGVAVNDAFLHLPTLQFGGVGESGTGAYRGRASFDVWVHRRQVTRSPGWMESLLSVRYPPYAGKLAKWKATSTLYPDFDRQGNKLRLGWLRTILTLGGGSAKAGVSRAATVAIVAYLVMQYLQRRSSKL